MAEQLAEIEIKKIVPDEENKHWHSEEDLNQLAVSIKSQGIIEPIIVRPVGGGIFKIIAGEARWRAAQKAELSQIPCIVKEIFDSTEAGILRLTENKVRGNYHFISECRELAGLHEKGLSAETLAKKFSEDIGRVRQKIAVGYIPAGILTEMFQAGFWTLSMTEKLLPLRSMPSGEVQKAGAGLADPSLFDHSEVEKIVSEVIENKITGSDYYTLIATRRLELQEKREKDILEVRVREEQAKIAQEYDQKLKIASAEGYQKAEQANSEKIQNLKKEVEKATAEARKARQEKAEIQVKESEKKGLKELLEKNEAEIALKDRETKDLLEKLAEAKEEAKEEAEKKSAQEVKRLASEEAEKYKKQLDEEFKKSVELLERAKQEEIKKAQLKTKQTINDNINHLIKVSAEVDSSLRNLIFGQFDKMDEEQINEIKSAVRKLAIIANQAVQVLYSDEDLLLALNSKES
ncbi:hypothetical protein COU05_01605 [bacterium (Candidatus Gribaldobacteria) CG10_big_fil_rev_8_21_14_0_10_37_21]|uniref:ParB-like N-terminal domain-containing protein n=1 Tax=bacterium (Candidatus Gribaldobacteria) CG10_big_fil_rev_8_21_14_0_10_37_21 TaxID=2014275 RepID=A0A2H0UUN5_9BACT|nr:MAG: hypothetical protein AUJ25_00175 [Parcubacteria group bacterium CG1_02_37_13]PIR90528.1 MAG: hypothetical protein COU05_01605 [bacterium (Candidatus Gribaldobacteria) CG10_big_fil_rev_8_21_14_0_10_37_21]